MEQMTIGGGHLGPFLFLYFLGLALFAIVSLYQCRQYQKKGDFWGQWRMVAYTLVLSVTHWTWPSTTAGKWLLHFLWESPC